MKQERKIYDLAFKRKAVELSNERSNKGRNNNKSAENN